VWILRVKVRFEVHRSPVGHIWHIKVRQRPDPISPPVVVFQHSKVARGDSGDLAVTHKFPNAAGSDALMVEAIDTQTGQVCGVLVWF
jgi:hypothetical protein